MKKISQNNRQISVVWAKSDYFLVNLAVEIIWKQHKNICKQAQTNECRNNFWLLLDFERRQTSAFFTDKTFAV